MMRNRKITRPPRNVFERHTGKRKRWSLAEREGCYDTDGKNPAEAQGMLLPAWMHC